MRRRICYLVLLCLPGIVFGWLWLKERSFDDWTNVAFLLGICVWCWVWSVVFLRREDHPMRTLSNLLSSLREGDYSIQARTAYSQPVLKDVFLELNALVSQLRNHRLGTVEASTLLQKILDEMDVVVVAFDSDDCLLWANPAAFSQLAASEKELLGKSASALHLEECLTGPMSRTLELRMGGRFGRWGIRRRSFREKGKLHQLVVLHDLSRALREEERLAWKRLIRVMGHELNNSLAPIVSISKSLESLLSQNSMNELSIDDFQKGLQVIQTRGSALRRFVDDYGKLARLPESNVRKVSIESIVRKCVSMESRLKVSIKSDNDVTIEVDPDQIEQLLINLLTNAADACLTCLKEQGESEEAYQPTIECGWKIEMESVELFVLDNGTGLGDTSNLFVPFFTTKPQGSGIGLALCRQIAEGHDGFLKVGNRPDGAGCVATLRLPFQRQ